MKMIAMLMVLGAAAFAQTPATGAQQTSQKPAQQAQTQNKEVPKANEEKGCSCCKKMKENPNGNKHDGMQMEGGSAKKGCC